MENPSFFKTLFNNSGQDITSETGYRNYLIRIYKADRDSTTSGQTQQTFRNLLREKLLINAKLNQDDI